MNSQLENYEEAKNWVKEMSDKELADDSRDRRAFHPWYVKALDEEIERRKTICKHQFEEQPGEPPIDVCFHCGEVRE